VKHAFLASCCAAAIGGYWVGMTQTLANTISISSWIGLVGFNLTPTTNILNWWNSLPSYFHPLFVHYDNGVATSGMSPIGSEAIAMSISAIFAFIFTCVFSSTKWGKRNIYDFTQVNEQTSYAKWMDKVLRKKAYDPSLFVKSAAKREA
jgi:PTS system sucrose-specific IIC component